MLNTADAVKTSYIARGINKERFEAILKFAGNSILDVGCGSGAYVLNLAEKYQVTGVDYQKFPSWEEKPHLFSISDAAELNLENNSVDTILSFETLEHLQNPEEALREYYRVCRKNIILTVPNCQITPGMENSKIIYYHWIDQTHVNFFNMEQIKSMVNDAGFNLTTSYYINQINLHPFITEAFDNSGFIRRMIHKALMKNQRHQYYLTSLIVAEK